MLSVPRATSFGPILAHIFRLTGSSWSHGDQSTLCHCGAVHQTSSSVCRKCFHLQNFDKAGFDRTDCMIDSLKLCTDKTGLTPATAKTEQSRWQNCPCQGWGARPPPPPHTHTVPPPKCEQSRQQNCQCRGEPRSCLGPRHAFLSMHVFPSTPTVLIFFLLCCCPLPPHRPSTTTTKTPVSSPPDQPPDHFKRITNIYYPKAGTGQRSVMRMGEVTARIFIAWLATFGSVLAPSGQSDRKNTRSHVLGRGNVCQHRQPRSQLFGNGSHTHPSIVAGNREYLGQTLGFSEDQLDKISTSKERTFLTLDTGVLKERVRWLTTRLDLKENEMKKIAQQSPRVLGRKPEESLAPKLEYLQTRLLLDDESMRKIILRTPSILGHSTKDNVKPKLDRLQRRLNLKDVGKVVRRCPQLLHCGMDTNIEPTLDWLQRRLDLGEAAVGKMIQT